MSSGQSRKKPLKHINVARYIFGIPLELREAQTNSQRCDNVSFNLEERLIVLLC